MRKKTLKKAVVSAGENARETLSSAAEKAAPIYDQTKEAVLDGLSGLTGNISEALDKASDTKAAEKLDDLNLPVGRKAAKKAAKQAKKLEKATKPKKKHRLLTFLCVVSIIGVIILVLRQILMPKDDGWTPHEPSGAFGNDDITTDFSDDFLSDDDSQDEAESHSTREYGEGAYVGDNPPEGYTIKGNERSMKYHTPDGAGYARTNADVWFVSNEAAEAAGFTKALR